MTPRVAALDCLLAVAERGESLSRALPPLLARIPDARDRGLAQELSYGGLRWYHRLDALLATLIERPLKPRDRDVTHALRLAAYELLYLDTPDYAVVNEYVELVKRRGKRWVGGLVNAVLRRLMRERETLAAAIDQDPANRLSHPRWLVERLRTAHPADWEALLAAGNARPPMTLRVDLARLTRAACLERLAGAGIAAEPHPAVASAVTLATPVDVGVLPGFAEGECSVQDAAAQLAAQLLVPQPGERVLDACAAPGGKTAHLAEAATGITLHAMDIDAERLARVQQNLDRIGATTTLIAGDAADPAAWWDRKAYDRILLDAPCSATGVIRRHPDIKLHRRPADIPELVRRQATILDALWPLLAPGGMLLYATCSVLPEENSQQLEEFLARHADARELPIQAAWGRAVTVGRQILTGDAGMDGFYYAALTKT
ncbi:MAG TPA: 16S rRNA (cytosine(967)-C(5))-methyltransferase RsmB [Thioalkalivibrio sp.]|nr:16S rRNA (cytosine(967)-C(5))-methyltransferase RsmB [Thioalkalivibrio sp.]